jgi:hypothetical protein
MCHESSDHLLFAWNLWRCLLVEALYTLIDKSRLTGLGNERFSAVAAHDRICHDYSSILLDLAHYRTIMINRDPMPMRNARRHRLRAFVRSLTGRPAFLRPRGLSFPKQHFIAGLRMLRVSRSVAFLQGAGSEPPKVFTKRLPNQRGTVLLRPSCRPIRSLQ